MGRVCAIGERALVEGYGLAGALVSVAEDAAAVRAAWLALPADTAIVILSPAAAAALVDRALVDRSERSGTQRLVVTLP